MIEDPSRGVIKTLSKPFPYGISMWNGVARKARPFFNLRWEYPDHKKQLAKIVDEHTTVDDTVVFIGAGRGVGPVRAARSGRKVVVYEAAKKVVTDMRETANLNGLNNDQLSVIHGSVGPEIDVYGDSDGATSYTTGEIDGDVLVVDAEGAEKEIIPAPTFETVIVETHPQFGAPTDRILTKMAESATVVMPNRYDGDYILRQ